MARGIDIHPYYQRGIRWAEVQDVHFAWVKVSDGDAAYTRTVGGVQYLPETQVNGAKSVGIPVGGYHYAELGDPVRQAEVLITEVERLGAVDVLPALDIEAPFAPNQAARDFGERFCGRVAELGHRPVAYMNDDFARVLKPAEWASNPLLWIARYGAAPVNTGYDVHQYSRSGALPGAAGAVDLDESYTDALFSSNQEDEMAGPIDHEYPGGTTRQYHHRTIETRSKSAVVGDVWFAISAGYHPMTTVTVYFNGVQNPINIPEIVADTRQVWLVPDGCESISWEYDCEGPSSSVVIYGKR